MIKTSAFPSRSAQILASFLNIGGVTKRVNPRFLPQEGEVNRYSFRKIGGIEIQEH